MSLMRILVVIFLFVMLGPIDSDAQIACPAMGITQVNANKNRPLSGFSSVVRNSRKKTQTGDFFRTKTSSASRYLGKDPFSFRSTKTGKIKEHTEFSTRSGRKRLFSEFDEFSSKSNDRNLFRDKDEFATSYKRKGRFRSYDEFASRNEREKRFRDYDEFAQRSAKRNLFHDKDEFATRSKRTRKVSEDTQFNSRTTVKRFRREKKRTDLYASKKLRSKQTRDEYSPFATTVSPIAAAPTHRKPQMGLWGGTVGGRSGKDSRPSQSLPETNAKKD